jgi:hypothetical protein
MICHFRTLLVVCLAVACLATFCLPGASPAAAADKTAATPPAKPPHPPVAVNVNVVVNVHTNVNVRIDAPFTPVVGSVQLPDFVQRFLAGFFDRSAKATPKPGPAAKTSPGGAKEKK